MLFAKINPNVQIINQVNPFVNETINCEYMGIIARPYVLGSEGVNFELRFGNVDFNEQLDPIQFNYVTSYNIKLSGNQLTNWGIDDRYIFDEVSQIYGFTIMNYIEMNDN